MSSCPCRGNAWPISCGAVGKELLATATRRSVFPAGSRPCSTRPSTWRDRYACGQLSTQGLAAGSAGWKARLEAAIAPPKSHAANERLAKHLGNHRHDLGTFLYFPGSLMPPIGVPSWRSVRRDAAQVWGGNRTWTGAHAQAVLMSVWRTCWQHGQNAVDLLSQLARKQPHDHRLATLVVQRNEWIYSSQLRIPTLPGAADDQLTDYALPLTRP